MYREQVWFPQQEQGDQIVVGMQDDVEVRAPQSMEERSHNDVCDDEAQWPELYPDRDDVTPSGYGGTSIKK
jgi:hypothetical protein